MPNVIGRSSAEAKTILVEHKLDLKIETEASAAFPEDVVSRTIPNPGESIQQGSVVTVIVSRGTGPLALGMEALASNTRVTIAQIFANVQKDRLK